MHGWSSSALAAVAGVIWGLGACTAPTFRPLRPRRAETNGQQVEISAADLRHFVIAIDVRGGAAPPRVEGAWVSAVGAMDGAPCARRLAASSVAPVPGAGPGQEFDARFDRALLDLLDGPSNLEVRVAGGDQGSRCVSLPLSGPDLDLAWRLEPWGQDRPFVGHAVTLWFPISTDRYSDGADVALLRLGRWWGPVRFGVGTGVGLTCCGHHDPNAAFAIPIGVGAEIFPLTAGRVALGLGVSYQLRPSWFFNDSNRGFELVHGPVGSVELAYLPHQLRGFLTGPPSGTVGLSLSVGRWLSDGGATVVGASLSIN